MDVNLDLRVFMASLKPLAISGAFGTIGQFPVADWRHEKRENLEKLFHQHAGRWKTETQHWSSVNRMLAHPSYLRIIGLAKVSVGREIERLLLEELEAEPDYWFDALAAITGENPVQPHQDFDESVSAWLEWGRKKGILSR